MEDFPAEDLHDIISIQIHLHMEYMEIWNMEMILNGCGSYMVFIYKMFALLDKEKIVLHS